ncbi:MAG: efflux RND transporter periplasmic adaptor subunit [Eubacteriales bacterium]|nr:efflux RND transporter periplasmic adaptor subunit [Eubacteriales bacterium]
MKKVGIIILALALVGAGAGGVWYFKFRDNNGVNQSDAEDAVFVDSVATIAGIGGGNGVNSRFSGVVEAQETVKIEVPSGMKVKEAYVTVGQEVSVGTRLFSYDTDEAQDNITQMEIDIENYDITIESTQAQIAQLEKERAKVSEDEKLAYTTQIMTAENSIKRAEYEKKSKQNEMENLKKQIANAYVTSELDGIVKTINKNNSGSSEDEDMNMDDGGMSDDSSSAYMTIMATGDYRIKGTVNEQNIQELMEGAQVIAHSRVDESLIWRGTVTKIDRESASSNQNNMFYSSGDSSMNNSSSYPFYVDLEDSAGLMLGQHVYVEIDNGQEDELEGIWLEEYYLLTDDDGNVTPYVWAASGKDILEKREVTLGEYNEDLMKYQILDGLTEDDYIAFPEQGYEEGMPVTRNTDQFSEMSYSDEDWLGEDGLTDDVGDDGFVDEGFIDDLEGDDFGGDDFIEDGGEEIFVEDGGDDF